MKKKILFIFSIILIAIICISCGARNTDYGVTDTKDEEKIKPHSIEQGTYGFEKATITNLITKEVTEKLFDDILNDKTYFKEWGVLFSFSIGIKKDTEFFYTKDNRCITVNEGLAYELVANNTLKLHFPRWQGYDYGVYDIVIIFSGPQKLYG